MLNINKISVLVQIKLCEDAFTTTKLKAEPTPHSNNQRGIIFVSKIVRRNFGYIEAFLS